MCDFCMDGWNELRSLDKVMGPGFFVTLGKYVTGLGIENLKLSAGFLLYYAKVLTCGFSAKNVWHDLKNLPQIISFIVWTFLSSRGYRLNAP